MFDRMKSWFARGRREDAPAARVPDGLRVYAVGDIHGHAREFDALLAQIDADLAGHGGDAHLVFLGDYIDRGPDSRAVLDRLIARDVPGTHAHMLLGNHERVLLDIVDDAAPSGPGWLRYGGFELLESYGLPREELLRRRRPLRQSIVETVDPAHLDFLRALPTRHVIGDYLFAHAGVRPGVAIEEQTDKDLLWIREGFIDSRRDHGKVVVHGHTIEDGPADRPNRIGLDTGCYAGGHLTAVRLEGTTRHFFSVPSEGRSWVRSS